MARFAVIVAILMLFATPAAEAASLERTFEAAGLFGTWAPNCAEKPSPDNPRVTVARGRKGTAIERDEFGPDYEVNRYLMVAVKSMGDHRLAIDALFQQSGAEPQRQLIVVEVKARTRRTLFTGTADEPPRVKDGIAVAVGKPTPTLNKCD